MKTQFKSILLLLLLLELSPAIAQEATSTHQDSLISVVDKYYELNLKIFQPNSTVSDVDMLFGIFTEDFVYVHPAYGGEYTREDLYSGYVRNQNNGAFNGSVVDIEILNKIAGLNAVVTQKRFIEMTDGKLENGKPEMTLFEFKNGKISRIFEYW